MSYKNAQAAGITSVGAKVYGEQSSERNDQTGAHTTS